MTDREHELPITKQAQALDISRGSVYYLPWPVPERDLTIMRRLDQMHMDYPFADTVMLSGLLNGEGFAIGRKHVGTLMKKMGISAHYRKPNTSKPEPGHKIFPYLLRSLEVERANQAGHGLRLYPAGQRLCLSRFAYWTGTRRVLSWRLSITMDTSFCIEAVQEAVEKHESPDIFNTDSKCGSVSLPSLRPARLSQQAT